MKAAILHDDAFHRFIQIVKHHNVFKRRHCGNMQRQRDGSNWIEYFHLAFSVRTHSIVTAVITRIPSSESISASSHRTRYVTNPSSMSRAPPDLPSLFASLFGPAAS